MIATSAGAQLARACRGCGWRSRACRCRAAAPRGARRSRAAASTPSDRGDRWRRSRSRGRSGGRSTATWRRSPRRTRSRCGRGGRRRRAAARSSGSHGATSGVGERLPERAVAQARAEGVDQRRVEPAAAALPAPCPRPRRRRRRRGRSPTVCARQTMRASSGISSPRRPSGWPRPSQCSSSARIASAVSVLRPISSAISAPRSQRACISRRVTSPSSLIALQPPAAVAQPAVGGDRAQRPHEGRQLAGPVDALGRALGDVVVGAEQRRHASGVRGAAGVLEQQRVEEIGAGRGVEPELLRPAACRSGTSGARGRAAPPR